MVHANQKCGCRCEETKPAPKKKSPVTKPKDCGTCGPQTKQVFWINGAGVKFGNEQLPITNAASVRPKVGNTPITSFATDPVPETVAPSETQSVTYCVEPGCTPHTYASLQALHQAAVTRINELRALKDPPAPPLVWSDQLAHAALMHATDHMIRGFNIRHGVPNSPWGIGPGDRAENSGWPDALPVAENIAVTSHHKETPADLSNVSVGPVDIWNNQYNDPGQPDKYLQEGHHINNMNATFRYIGIGMLFQPDCMQTAPGYLNFGSNTDYLLNPYNHFTGMTDIFTGATLTQWIWGRCAVVYKLSTDLGALIPTDPPDLFDTCYPATYTDTVPLSDGALF